MTNNIRIEIVKEARFGNGYSWSTAQIGKDAFNNHWLRSGSGCSCNSIDSNEWLPLRNIGIVRSALKEFELESDQLAKKSEFIAFAQSVLGGTK